MEMQDMLADRLKQKRALSHASLEEYSKELGISKSALQKIEAYQEYIRCRHNAFCKAVIRYAAIGKIIRLRQK